MIMCSNMLTLNVLAQEEDLELLKAQDIDALKLDTESIFENDAFMLPPLAALIDSAIVYSPLLRQYDAQMEIRDLERRGVKNDWANNLYTIAEWKYGSTENVVFVEDGNNTIIGGSANTARASRSQLGVGLRLTLFDITQRKRVVAIADAKYDYAAAQRDEIIQLIRKDVTLLFNDLILSQRLLTIKSETQQAKLLHFNLAEKQFLEGELPVSDYSKIIEMIAKSSAEFEEAKMDFTNKYFLLEMAVGLKLDELKRASR